MSTRLPMKLQMKRSSNMFLKQDCFGNAGLVYKLELLSFPPLNIKETYFWKCLNALNDLKIKTDATERFEKKQLMLSKVSRKVK